MPLMDLATGVGLRINGIDWTVVEVRPHLGHVVLDRAGGDTKVRTIRWLMNHPDCVPATAPLTGAAVGGNQPVSKTDLDEAQLDRARRRAAHVLEAETGFRSGNPLWALSGEPRPAYDPARTTVTERRRAKAAELAALAPEDASALGLANMSERTLRRLSARSATELISGCADGRWTRRRGGHPSITEEIREAIFAVKRECGRRSRISMRARHRLMHQYVVETFPDFPVEAIPGYFTLRIVWLEWFGTGGGRQRYVRSAESLRNTSPRVVVHRPGQVVALDTTPLPVKVRESVFGDPVTVMLTLALDLYTHSVVASASRWSRTSVDIAMLLRDVLMPLPMREDWGPDMEWPYPGVPAALVAEFAGHKVAALPFFAPETLTTDHGSAYKNHHVVEAERSLGCNILPARTLRPTDKFAVDARSASQGCCSAPSTFPNGFPRHGCRTCTTVSCWHRYSGSCTTGPPPSDWFRWPQAWGRTQPCATWTSPRRGGARSPAVTFPVTRRPSTSRSPTSRAHSAPWLRPLTTAIDG